ncbi:MAG TPA: response regulator [Allosphingosinicella sp.]|uniref:response regulator transcription factor n=1 Tax=Allosphingosinicella sp. TaxID=2823234 RepID=UPI002EDA83B9
MTSAVYIVDDDRDVRSSISFMLGTAGRLTRAFAGGQDFLDSLDHLEPGCILLDIRMPDIDGVEVLEALNKRGITWPVIIMTGHGEVALAVQTMKMGALDFVEKPFEEDVLLGSLEKACDSLAAAVGKGETKREAKAKLESLTPRERQVLQGLVGGLSNKGIANHLGISLRTAEMHRAHMMQRLGARSLADAVNFATDAGLEPLR